jgi:hypothetical protein
VKGGMDGENMSNGMTINLSAIFAQFSARNLEASSGHKLAADITQEKTNQHTRNKTIKMKHTVVC